MAEPPPPGPRGPPPPLCARGPRDLSGRALPPCPPVWHPGQRRAGLGPEWWEGPGPGLVRARRAGPRGGGVGAGRGGAGASCGRRRGGELCAGPWAWARARARAPAMSQDGGAGRIKGTGPLPHPHPDRARRSPESGERRGLGAEGSGGSWRRGGHRLLGMRAAAAAGKGLRPGPGGGAAGQMERWGRGGPQLLRAAAQGAGTRGRSRTQQ